MIKSATDRVTKAKRIDRFDIMRAVRNLSINGEPLNMTRLALYSGLDGSACLHALDRPQLGGEIAIANALDVDPAVLWPDRYREPLSQVRSNALEAFRASQKTKAERSLAASA